MNKKISALILSCLFINATTVPMDEDLCYPDGSFMSETLSCGQKVETLIPCALSLAVAAGIDLGIYYIGNDKNNDIPFMVITSIAGCLFGCVCSRAAYIEAKKNNFQKKAHHPHALRDIERAHENVSDSSSAEEASSSSASHIEAHLDPLENDLSKKDVLTFLEAHQFQERLQAIQERNDITEDHETALAEIDAAIKEKVMMGLQTHVKSAGKDPNEN